MGKNAPKKPDAAKKLSPAEVVQEDPSNPDILNHEHRLNPHTGHCITCGQTPTDVTTRCTSGDARHTPNPITGSCTQCGLKVAPIHPAHARRL